MNSNSIKMNLLVSLPGSTPYTEEECIKTTVDDSGNIIKCVDYTMKKHHTMKVYDPEKKVLDIINFHTNKCKPAQQSVNMTDDAYEAFVSAENPAKGIQIGHWKQMSKMQRIAAHMADYAESLGGEVINFEVYDK